LLRIGCAIFVYVFFPSWLAISNMVCLLFVVTERFERDIQLGTWTNLLRQGEARFAEQKTRDGHEK